MSLFNSSIFKQKSSLNIRFVLFFVSLMSSLTGYAQLDSLHYLPPLKQVGNNQAIEQQVIYLSTPVTTAFNVNVYRGTDTTPYFTVTNLAKGTPQRLDNTVATVPNILANGNNHITLVRNDSTGVVLKRAGLRFVSPNGEKFYVNYRGRSNSQAGSLTSKGTKALGTDFRWGGIPNRADNAHLSTSLGMMATEDGTTVTVSGYDPNCEFRSPAGRGAITANTLTINLDAGETYVIEAAKNQTTANVDGWLGATLTSNKPIAISNGGLNTGIDPTHQSRDVGIDQPVPTNLLGREYLYIRGNGNNESEFPIIVATQNGTEVFVYTHPSNPGNATSIATLNDGDYFEIPGSYYSGTSAGANMYVTTSKEVYAYQCLTGKENSRQTIGMNFLVPLNCLLPNKMDEVSEIDDIAGLSADVTQSGITIIASTATPNANITVTEDGVSVILPAPVIPAGTSDWKTFFVTGLSGRVSVNSSGPIAVGTFLTDDSNAGLAGYFSGYDTVPEINVIVTGGGCFGNGDLQENSGDIYDAYQWYKDGAAIPGANSATYSPTALGDYYLEVTEGGCTYSSPVTPLYNCDPDIVLTKNADVTQASDGDLITYTITVESVSLFDVYNIIIHENFPSTFLNLISATPTFGTWNSTTLEWDIGTMSSGEIHTLTIVAQVKDNVTAGTATNSISNTQTPADSNTTPDDLTAEVTIIPSIIDLSLTKTVDNALAKVGDVITFSITVKNSSSDSVSSIQIKDELPANLTYSTSTIPPIGTTYNQGTGIWDLGAIVLNTNDTLTLHLKATVTGIGEITNITEIIRANKADIDSTRGSTD